MAPKPGYASETTWELLHRFLKYLTPGDSVTRMDAGPGHLFCQRASQVLWCAAGTWSCWLFDLYLSWLDAFGSGEQGQGSVSKSTLSVSWVGREGVDQEFLQVND